MIPDHEKEGAAISGHFCIKDPPAPLILQALPKRKDILSPPLDTAPSTDSSKKKTKNTQQVDTQHSDLMFSTHLPFDKHKNAFCWAFSLLTFLSKNINARKKAEPNALGNDTKYKQWVKSLCFSGMRLNKLFQNKNAVLVQTLNQLIIPHFYGFLGVK